MRFSKYVELPKLFTTLLFSFCALLFYHVGGQAEPYPLALVYAMQIAGLSPVVPLLFLFFSALIWGNSVTFLLYLGQCAFLFICYLIQKRIKNTGFGKTNLLPMLALSLSLGAFVAFSPFTPYALPFDFQLNALAQKALISLLIFLLSACLSVATKAILRKLLKCRLHVDELIFSALFCILTGIGFCRLFSVNAYLGASFFILLAFGYVTKNPSTLLCAFLLCLPPYIVARYPVSRFFVYGVIVTFFIQSGKLITVCAYLCAFFTFGYFDGIFTLSASQLAQTILSAMLPALLFIICPNELFKIIENKLVFYREKHLTRIAINRNRTAIGEKLHELSSVFREIECTFSALGTNEAEAGAKEYIRSSVMEEVCKNCKQYRICLRKNVQAELDSLIDVGCLKGRASLLDLPKSFADECYNQSSVLTSVNRQLNDYKKYMTETENAASGRMLLANQAQGVSEILKSLALEQSQPLRIYTEKERALSTALLNVGIVCSEVLIFGEEHNLTLSLITFGKSDVKKIAQVASHFLQMDMLISERIALSQDKFCCVLKRKPHFDAAFGVASVKKFNSLACGDTHSVIKIDERRFMVALSDGMGSGEYAKKISESTISLLESFYRAKMPSELVLSTINKLLTFSKEETFACVDIGIIDLDDGNADVVKIGSPLGFILTTGAVKVLEGGSLPLGILDSLHPTSASYTLHENDVLLFLSDGITDAFGSTSDLYEALKTLSIRNPQQLVDELLRLALDCYGGSAKDDMTAVAVRLFKSS